MAARPVESVSAWCERIVHFNEPGCVGPFSCAGREYLREPLDNFSDQTVTDQVCVMATRAGKTRILYGGTAWTVANEPSRILYVKPKSKGAAGAEDDARTRFIPMLRASPELRALIPTGARRHEFKAAQQILGGSIVDWTGSNSVSALASNPCRVVIQDEGDKFNTTRKRDEEGNEVEADASALADERAKEFSNPKRFKASTPTLVNGLTWQELIKSDLRRYFVPCPHCAGDVVFAWSPDFTVLAKTGCEAYVKWDREAKDEGSGRWDFPRVERTAHAECPHCKGKILDTHKTRMVRAGRWRATQPHNSPRRGYHLPAMYCAHRETNFGRMAVRFLQACQSLEGVRGFVNADLAEPYLTQGVKIDRKGAVRKEIEITGEWFKILSVDFQESAPYFWAIVRAWNGTDETHGIEYRCFNQWSDVDDLQEKHKVTPEGVIIDVGFSQSQVLQECANIKMGSRSNLVEGLQGTLPECVGWNPSKAFGGKRLFKDDQTHLYLPYRLKRDVDPYAGTELAKKMRIELLEFLNDIFEDMLDNIRSGNTGLKWTISEAMNCEEYHRHMAGKVRKMSKTNPRDYKWESLSRTWPDHLHSCELLSLVLAYRLQLISFDAIKVKEEKKT